MFNQSMRLLSSAGQLQLTQTSAPSAQTAKICGHIGGMLCGRSSLTQAALELTAVHTAAMDAGTVPVPRDWQGW
jgi:hypothetical protein